MNLPKQLEALKEAKLNQPKQPWHSRYSKECDNKCWEEYWSLEKAARSFLLRTIVAHLSALFQLGQLRSTLTPREFLRYLDGGGQADVMRIADSLAPLEYNQLLVMRRGLIDEIREKMNADVLFCFDECQELLRVYLNLELIQFSDALQPHSLWLSNYAI